MVKSIFLAFIIFMVLNIDNDRKVMGSPIDLSQFKWKKRLLLLFAPDRHHSFFNNLHQTILDQKTEVEDRDLVIFEIFESGPSKMNMNYLDSQEVQHLRENFNIQESEFAVILIGKDGGIKLMRRDKTELEDIFGLIDSMPMRQEEIQEKSQTP